MGAAAGKGVAAAACERILFGSAKLAWLTLGCAGAAATAFSETCTAVWAGIGATGVSLDEVGVSSVVVGVVEGMAAIAVGFGMSFAIALVVGRVDAGVVGVEASLGEELTGWTTGTATTGACTIGSAAIGACSTVVLAEGDGVLELLPSLAFLRADTPPPGAVGPVES